METRGCYKLKDEAVDRTLYRTGCGSEYWPLVEQTTEYIKSLLVLFVFALEGGCGPGQGVLHNDSLWLCWFCIANPVG